MYHIPLHCYYIRYNVYILYSCSRITVLISFSVSLALYNRHARKEKCTRAILVYIYIYISSVETIIYFFFYSSPDNPAPPPSTHRHHHSISHIEIPRHISSLFSCNSVRQVYKHTHIRASSLSITTLPPLVKTSPKARPIVLPKQLVQNTRERILTEYN